MAVVFAIWGLCFGEVLEVFPGANRVWVEVENKRSQPVLGLVADAEDAPGWLVFRSGKVDVPARGKAELPLSLEVVGAEEGQEGRLALALRDAEEEILKVELKVRVAFPRESKLLSNFPDPFNPSTRIPYVLSDRVRARLEVFNSLGQRIRTLVDEVQGPGRYVVVWDGRDEDGREVGVGVYFFRLSAGDFCKVEKGMLLK